MTCCSRSEHFEAEFVTTQTSANERRRRKDRGAEGGAEEVESGEGTPPPQPTREFVERRKLPGSAANEFVEFYTATSRL